MASFPSSDGQATPLDQVLRRERQVWWRRLRRRTRLGAVRLAALVLFLLIVAAVLVFINQSTLPLWAKVVVNILLPGAGLSGFAFDTNSESGP
jgi:uncharacterized protein YqhQ